MKPDASNTGRQLLAGTVRIFAAEALLLPTGVLTAAFLSRSFGPEGYGMLALAGAVVAWVEGGIASALSRPSIKLIGETKDWRPTGATVVRLYALAGAASALALFVLAGPVASLVNDVALATYLRLFALEIPLFSLAQAHRNILVGTGRFRERARASVVRWLARLLLIVAFVSFSDSLAGAVWGSVFASLVELAVCRYYVRPPLFGGAGLAARRLLSYALPLTASAIGVSLFSRMDLIFLKTLGATATATGFYAVAQNVALLPGLFSFALSPALLSTLSRHLRDGEEQAARHVARQAMRAILLLLPFVAIVAGAATEIVRLVFGAPFVEAAPLLGPLALGALALVLVWVGSSILVVAAKPTWTLLVTCPLLLAAACGHALMIPRMGAMGAALVTVVCGCAAATATVLLVRKLWRISPPAATFARSLFISALVFIAAVMWPAAGAWLVVKLACVSAFSVAALLLLGEFSTDELAWARTLFRGRVEGSLELPREAS